MKENARRILYQFLILILSVLFSMGLFLAAYLYDNKYTLHTPQPIGGILFFNPDIDPMTHLMNGWQFYKDKLLTPEDFAGELPLPDGYVSIGQYPGIETGRQNASPHGSITYSLMLSLPDTPATYTLELPEIYSSYQFYVNGRLAASSGNPDKENYSPEIYSRSVTFEASGNTRLILAVSDWSWLYSGLIYPPAFGRAEVVGTLLEQKFAWGLAVTVMALMLGIMQAFLSFILQNRYTLYSSCICIAFAASVSSPVLHRLMPTGIVPYYPLELFSRYAVYGFAILLVNRLYGGRSRNRIIVSAAAALFPLAAFGTALAAPGLTYRGMIIFSHAAEIYKIICALWIIYTAFLIGKKRDLGSNHLILLAGACVFASSLAADRLLPSFEPIRFGWFSETAGLLFVLSISFLMLKDSFRIYKERGILLQQKEQLQVQIHLQKEHYADLVEQMQTIRIMRHDIRHHFTQLTLFLENGAYEEAENYLNQVNETASTTATPLRFSENYTADVLFRYYYAKAKKAGITLSIKANLPPDAGIPEEDLSVILGNILENALEANLLLPEGDRFMELTITRRSDNLFIESANAFNGDVRTEGENYYSSKKSGRLGIGLSSVRAMAEKYQGSVWVDTGKRDGRDVFAVNVILVADGE